jgi:hypothetical protein
MKCFRNRSQFINRKGSLYIHTISCTEKLVEEQRKFDAVIALEVLSLSLSHTHTHTQNTQHAMYVDPIW